MVFATYSSKPRACNSGFREVQGSGSKLGLEVEKGSV